jgi:DeoR/GlpR family transcriptional regulator of sugar metabolism
MTSWNDLSSYERQRELIRLVGRTGRLSVAQICAQFSISEATARRDLERLSEQGFIQRVHGGAILVTRQPGGAGPAPKPRAGDERAHGRAAAALIQTEKPSSPAQAPRSCGSPSTTWQKITVITNSCP